MKDLFKDRTGKTSMKRIGGALGLLVAFVMAMLPFFVKAEYIPSDTMVLGILTASFAAISVGVFEKK